MIKKWPVQRAREIPVIEDPSLLPCPLCGSKAVLLGDVYAELVDEDSVGCSREHCLFWYKWERHPRNTWQKNAKYAQRNISEK